MGKQMKPVFAAMLWVALAVFVLMSPQLYRHALIVGNDWVFHMNRFYEAAMQIKTGHFNYFQSLFGFQQSGRVINALYGSDFAYFNGLLLLISTSWFRFQMLSDSLCLFVAGMSMYALARSAKLTHQTAKVMAVMYLATPAVIYYPAAQAFTGWGAAFLPLAMIPAIKMIQDPKQPIQPVWFALAISLMLSVHMFSALICVLATMPFFIVGWLKTPKRWLMIRQALLAVGLTLLFSGNVFAALLELHGDNLIKPFRVADMQAYTMTIGMGTAGWQDLGLIFSVVFLAIAGYVAYHWRQTDALLKTMVSVGVGFLILASPLIPWNQLAQALPGLGQMQFPQRLSVVTFVMLILSLGIIVARASDHHALAKGFLPTMMVIVASMSVYSGYRLMANQSQTWHSATPLATQAGASVIKSHDATLIREAFSKKQPWQTALTFDQKMMPDYLPTTAKDSAKLASYPLYHNEVIANPLPVHRHVTKANTLQLTYQQTKSAPILPVIVYRHSIVKLDGKTLKSSQYRVSKIGALISPSTRSGNHTIEVGYQPSHLFKIWMIVRIVSLIGLLIYCGWYLFRRVCQVK